MHRRGYKQQELQELIAMNDVEQLRLKSILGQPEQVWT